MNRILLTTAFLAAGTGAALAEVTVSGDARMGILSAIDTASTPQDESALSFTSRARVIFTLAGTSDSGLSFGATFRADNASGASAGTGGTVFIAGTWGKLSMGDTDSAAKAAVGNVAAISLTGLGDLNESFFIANGGTESKDLLGGAFMSQFGRTSVKLTSDPSWLYEYDAGQVTIYLSGTLPDYSVRTSESDSFLFDGDETLLSGNAYAVGVTYEGEGYTVSAGYESLRVRQMFSFGSMTGLDLEQLVIGASGTLGAWTFRANYADGSGTVTNVFDGYGGPFRSSNPMGFNQYALSVTWTDGPLSVTGFLRNAEVGRAGGILRRAEKRRGNTDITTYGIGAAYDLGAGATLTGGIAQIRDKGAFDQNQTVFDVGVSLTF